MLPALFAGAALVGLTGLALVAPRALPAVLTTTALILTAACAAILLTI